MTEDDIKKIIIGSKSRSNASYNLFGYNNQNALKKVDFYLKKFEISFKKEPKYCKNCGELLDSNIKSFCNNSCSATFNNKNRKHEAQTKEKISNTLKEKNNFKKRICLTCGNIYTRKERGKSHFCSKECKNKYMKDILRESGLKSVLSQNRRSKNEIYFAELCQKEFENVLINEQIFNGWDADVILQDHKIAILWNGNWHHKRLSKKHSLEQVKNRDEIKIKEIRKMEYLPYIIDDYGKFNKNFVEGEFYKLKNFLKN